MSDDELPFLQPGYSSQVYGSADVAVNGETYTDSPRLNSQSVPTGVDVLMGRVGRSQIALGIGGYHAPRS